MTDPRAPRDRCGGLAGAVLARAGDLASDEAGATAIEYAIIAGSICTVIVVGLTSVGVKLSGVFTNVTAGFKG